MAESVGRGRIGWRTESNGARPNQGAHRINRHGCRIGERIESAGTAEKVGTARREQAIDEASFVGFRQRLAPMTSR